jgi:hypothetical protein
MPQLSQLAGTAHNERRSTRPPGHPSNPQWPSTRISVGAHCEPAARRWRDRSKSFSHTPSSISRHTVYGRVLRWIIPLRGVTAGTPNGGLIIDRTGRERSGRNPLGRGPIGRRTSRCCTGLGNHRDWVFCPAPWRRGTVGGSEFVSFRSAATGVFPRPDPVRSVVNRAIRPTEPAMNSHALHFG